MRAGKRTPWPIGRMIRQSNEQTVMMVNRKNELPIIQKFKNIDLVLKDNDEAEGL